MVDPEVTFPVLLRHGVDFLVVGGIAVATHGYPRATFDVDILPSPDLVSMRLLANALSELEAQATDDRGRQLPLNLTNYEGLSTGNCFLTTQGGALDLVNGSRPDLKRYKALASRSHTLGFAGFELKVIGLSDLIAMKRKAGREKDLRDIAALTEVERSRASD